MRDFYQRFWKPEANDRELVRAGRFGVVLMLVLALVFTTLVGSIGGAWKFFTLMAAGAGIIAIVRWLWWRVNAYSELSALLTAAITTLVLMLAAPEWVTGELYHWGLLVVVGISALGTFIATWSTAPVPREHLRAFYLRVRPIGFWGVVRETDDPEPGVSFGRILAAWASASAGLFALLFGLGTVLLKNAVAGTALFALGAVLWTCALHWAGALPWRSQKSSPARQILEP